MPPLYKKITTPIRLRLEKMGLMKVRKDFLTIFPKNTIGAELGVFQGKLSKDILEVARPKELHLMDPWWKVIGEYYGDWSRYHNDGELLSTKKAYRQAVDNVKSADNHHVAVFHIDDDLITLAKFPDNYFDWVYLDSSHQYEQTVKELSLLEKKVKPDGIIAGHDWYPDPKAVHHGVYKAVHEFCNRHNWEVFKLDKKFTQWAIRKK